MILEKSSGIKSIFILSTTFMASLIDSRGKGLEIPKIPLGTVPIIQSGQPRELELGAHAGQNICNDCFNRVFDCSIRVYRFSWSPQAEWGPGQNAPVARPAPPLSGPEYSQLAIVVLIMLLLYGEPLHIAGDVVS